MNRLLTRRDKSSHRRSKSSEPKIDKPRPVSSSGIFALFKPADKLVDKKAEKIDTKKISEIKEKLLQSGIVGIEDPQIEYALQTKYADGNVDRANELLELFQESIDGILKPFDPKVKMLGAENREAVTCYLDALLFAMFARLSSFERLLFKDFDEEPKRRLSTLIRLWVNMLRTGKLIQTDFTKQLQEALKACGWEEAAELCQQDTSEAFGFITETLELPLLTLEVDLYHEGKADATDDHKFINERLLEVAVPAEPENGRSIRLEDCLEDHFNARVEVVRQMERRNTLQRMASQSSTRTGALSTVDEKITGAANRQVTSGKDEDEQDGTAEHVEDTSPNEPESTPQPDIDIVLSPVEELPADDVEGENGVEDFEVIEAPESSEAADANEAKPIEAKFENGQVDAISDARPQTPIVQSPITFSNSPTPMQNRTRSTSFVRRYTVSQEESGQPSTNNDSSSMHSSTRKASLRKEILMPAWQFFRIIPWYTKQVPSTDSQVAAHFNSTRPVLGICLKRYAMNRAGKPIRQNTAIDIPLQIALPTFVQDDRASENGALFGNFVLKLQSVVCHRGNSLHSGHYIALAREEYQTKEEDNTLGKLSGDDDIAPPEYSADRWLKFDDLAHERVQYVDIEKAMKEEMPYLLFYQVQPIYPDPPSELTDPQVMPPSYKESNIEMFVQESTPITPSPGTNPFYQSRSEPPFQFFDSSTTTIAESTTTVGDSTSTTDEVTKPRVSFSDTDRPSLNSDGGRKSYNFPDSERRGSLAFTDVSNTSNPTTSQPVTPGEETTSSRLSRAASIFGRKGVNKSRPTSHVDESRGDNRISSTFSRISLNLMTKASKEPLLDKSRSGESGGSGVIETNLAEVIEVLRAAKDKENLEKTGSEAEPSLSGPPETGLAPQSDIGRSLSKKGKKGKSKGTESTASDNSAEKHHHYSHHHSHSLGGKEKGKGKDKDGVGEKDDSDRRECVLM